MHFLRFQVSQPSADILPASGYSGIHAVDKLYSQISGLSAIVEASLDAIALSLLNRK
jgi:hypothetical protein